MKQPNLIIIVGLPGTGKTTFAKALVEATGAEHLNSDIVRHTLGWRGRYDVESKAAVYQEMLTRTDEFLTSRKTVVVDATFYKKSLRQPYLDLAKKHKILARWIELRANEETIRERVGKKRKYSEADFDVYRRIKEDYEPLEMDHLVLWSDQIPLDEMVEKGREYLHSDMQPLENE
jgi:predicted kinase